MACLAGVSPCFALVLLHRVCLVADVARTRSSGQTHSLNLLLKLSNMTLGLHDSLQ
jgi:hypothetical protein